MSFVDFIDRFESSLKNTTVGRRDFLKGTALMTTDIVLGGALLDACTGYGNQEIEVGKDVKGPFSTSDGRQATLDFSEIELRAKELTMFRGMTQPVSPEVANPHPKIKTKTIKQDGKEVAILDVGSTKDLDFIGRVQDLRLYKIGLVDNLDQAGFYPTVSGESLGWTGRVERKASEFDDIYGLKVLTLNYPLMAQEKFEDALVVGYLAFELHEVKNNNGDKTWIGTTLGYLTDPTAVKIK